MKISHEEYLKQKSKDIKLQLNNLNLQHQIDIAIYNTKREFLTSQLDSIDKQLNY